MKTKILLFLAVIGLGQGVKGQNIFPSTGDVTIGSSSGGSNYKQDAMSGWLDAFVISRAGTQIASIGSDGVNKLQFFTGNGTSSSTARMTILDNGKVGIGNATPGSMLDIQSDVDRSGFRLQGGNPYDLFYLDLSSFKINNNPDVGYSFSIKNRDLVYNNLLTFNNGNIGIANATPSSVLDIQSDVDRSAFRIQGGKPYNTFYLDISSFKINDNPEVGYSLNIKNNSQVYNNLLVFNNGNVGIGTTITDAKLTVKGDIHAREVRVDLVGGVADYVFAPTYNLRPLAEVEQFVKANSHLPEIPSAKEVAQNGVNLGEMQNKLLQKVEELTLYVIEQEKKQSVTLQKLEELRKENEKMKAEMIEIKNGNK
jgi:hypothetical protein